MLSLNRPLLKTALFFSLALTCLLPLPQVEAQSLIFTEVNDNTLTVALSSSPNTPYGTVSGAHDNWTWHPPTSVVFDYFVGPAQQWAEPDNSGEVNVFLPIGNGPFSGLYIISDAPPYGGPGYLPTYANDSSGFLAIHDPLPPGALIAGGMIFIDEGDAVAVSDRSSSLGLLFIAGLGLIGGVSLGPLQRCWGDFDCEGK